MTADLLDELEASAPTVAPEPVSARTTTRALMAALERHYIKPSAPMPGGIFVPEVGVNGAWGASARCDAIYVGFTSTSGRLLIGHEVKASRADWLHELAQPGKADPWADQCHEWWLVTVPGVVHEGELPAGWGLMVPGQSKTRMRVLMKAQRHEQRQPSWDAVRSIMARQDTLRAQAITDQVTKATAKIRADTEADLERRIAARVGDSDWEVQQRERDRAELNGYREALGVHLVENHGEHGRLSGTLTTEELADLVQLLRTHDDLATATARLVGRYGPIASLRRHFDDLEQAIRDATNTTARPTP